MAAVTELRRVWPEFRRRLRRTLRRLVLVVRQPSTVRLNGVELELGPWATAPVRRAIYQGWYERNEHDVLLATLRPEDTVLELGCGAGYITTVAARIAREVRAFDGNPDIVAVARDTVTHNGCVATVENAVVQRAPSEATVRFYLEPDFPGSSLKPSHSGHAVDAPTCDFTTACQACTYLVVDIEGAEVELLRTEMPGVRAICVETHPWRTGLRPITEMLASLMAQGFMLDVEQSRGIVLHLRRDLGEPGVS